MPVQRYAYLPKPPQLDYRSFLTFKERNVYDALFGIDQLPVPPQQQKLLHAEKPLPRRAQAHSNGPKSLTFESNSLHCSVAASTDAAGSRTSSFTHSDHQLPTTSSQLCRIETVSRLNDSKPACTNGEVGFSGSSTQQEAVLPMSPSTPAHIAAIASQHTTVLTGGQSKKRSVSPWHSAALQRKFSRPCDKGIRSGAKRSNNVSLDTSFLCDEDTASSNHTSLPPVTPLNRRKAAVMEDSTNVKATNRLSELSSPCSGGRGINDSDMPVTLSDDLLQQIRDSTAILFLMSPDDDHTMRHMRKSNGRRFLQISFVLSEHDDQWGTFYVPLIVLDSECEQPSTHSYRYDDLCLAEWLLDADGYNKQNQITASRLHPLQKARSAFTRWHGVQKRLGEDGLMRVYRLELSIIPILIEMELWGLLVDMNRLQKLDATMMSGIKYLEKKANALIGSPISLNSHIQLRQVLFDKLKLDQKLPTSSRLRTSRNQLSTSEPVLTQLAPYHPLPTTILKYRQLFKVHSTYIVGMLPYIKDGVLKTQWDQTSAATGRLQSVKPNLQSIPKTGTECPSEQGGLDDEILLHARSIFKARDGCTFMSVDFKQVELRIYAHLIDDKKLISILEDDNVDIFVNLACVRLSKDKDGLTEEDREVTKRLVYSIIYGVGKHKLSQQLSITPMEAQSLMNRFLREFPGIQKFSAKVINESRAMGFATSILGRRRQLNDLKHNDFKIRSHCERQAVNFTIQGSAADLCKVAMRVVTETIRQKSLDARLVVQIHDELLFEVRDEHITAVKGVCEEHMQCDAGIWHEDIALRVPLRVSIKTGRTWADIM